MKIFMIVLLLVNIFLSVSGMNIEMKEKLLVDDEEFEKFPSPPKFESEENENENTTENNGHNYGECGVPDPDEGEDGNTFYLNENHNTRFQKHIGFTNLLGNLKYDFLS